MPNHVAKSSDAGFRDYAFDVYRKFKKPNVYAAINGLISMQVFGSLFDGLFNLLFGWRWCGCHFP